MGILEDFQTLRGGGSLTPTISNSDLLSSFQKQREASLLKASESEIIKKKEEEERKKRQEEANKPLLFKFLDKFRAKPKEGALVSSLTEEFETPAERLIGPYREEAQPKSGLQRQIEKGERQREFTSKQETKSISEFAAQGLVGDPIKFFFGKLPLEYTNSDLEYTPVGKVQEFLFGDDNIRRLSKDSVTYKLTEKEAKALGLSDEQARNLSFGSAVVVGSIIESPIGNIFGKGSKKIFKNAFKDMIEKEVGFTLNKEGLNVIDDVVKRFSKESSPATRLSIVEQGIKELTQEDFIGKDIAGKIMADNLPVDSLSKESLRFKELLEIKTKPARQILEPTKAAEASNVKPSKYIDDDFVKTVDNILTKTKKQPEREVNKLINQVDKLKKEADSKLLKEGIKLRARADKAIKTLLNKYSTKEAVQKAIVEFAQEALPKDVRGKFMKKLADASTVTDQSKVFRDIHKEASKIYRNKLETSLKDAISNIDKVPIKERAEILYITEKIKFKDFQSETIKKLSKTREFLERSPEMKKFFSKKELEKLDELEKINVSELSLDKIARLIDRIEVLKSEGLLKKKLRAESKKRKLNELAKDVGDSSVNIDTITKKPRQIGEAKLTGKARAIDILSKIKGNIKDKYLRLTFMDRIFDAMDGGVGYTGKNYKVFKEPVDRQFSKYLQRSSDIKDRFWEKYKELGLKPEDFERIGVYAIDKQRNGRKKLLNSGLTDSQIDEIVLTANEKEMYNWMRKELDDMRPDIDEVLKSTYDKELEVVDDYFPMITDYERSGAVVDEVTEDFRRATTQKGFTKARGAAGKGAVEIDALNSFLKHVDDATYFIEMDPLIRDLGSIARNEAYQTGAGETATKIVTDWLDALSRKGLVAGQNKLPSWVNKVRKNTSVALFAYKLSTVLKQPLALLNGAAELGGNIFLKFPKIIKNKELREYVKKASPEVANRVAGDPGYIELAEIPNLNKFNMVGLSFMQRMDALTASAVWVEAYEQALKKEGKKFSMDAVVDSAAKEADRIVRLTQATGNFKDLPPIMVGQNSDLAKVFFHFQNFALNNWDQLSKDMPKAFKEDKKKGVQMLFYLSMGMYIDDAVNSGLYSVFYPKREKQEESLSERFVNMTFGRMPIVGNIINSYRYSSNPIPIVNFGEKALSSSKQLIEGKKDKTKLRGLAGLLESIGMFTGIGGSAQAGQVVRGLLDE